MKSFYFACNCYHCHHPSVLYQSCLVVVLIIILFYCRLKETSVWLLAVLVVIVHSFDCLYIVLFLYRLRSISLITTIGATAVSGNLYRFQLLVLVLNGRSSVIGNSVDSIDGSVVLISVGNECICRCFYGRICSGFYSSGRFCWIIWSHCRSWELRRNISGDDTTALLGQTDLNWGCV